MRPARPVAVSGSRERALTVFVVTLAQFIGQALGVAVLGSLVYAGVVGGAAGGVRLYGAQSVAFVDGLHHAVLVSGGCLLVAALLASALIPSGLLSRA